MVTAGSSAAVAGDGVQATPFAARPNLGGEMRFVEISSAQSGIDSVNEFADPKMGAERYHEFTLGAIGTGVALADFDNDGKCDVFLVNKTGQNRLYRNTGDWKFEDVTARTGLLAKSDLADGGESVENWKQGASFADVNNDGWLDLYVCYFGAANRLYLNQGDGSFREEGVKRGLAVIDSSGMGNFCDYDRDGWLDVYVHTSMLDAANQPEGRKDYLFRNKGDGYFEDVTDQAGIRGNTLVHSTTWWDFDQDGWPDIYTADDFAAPDRLYRNNRDGTFTDVIHEVVPHMPYSSMGADLGDVNGDGWLDLIVADMAATTHEKDQRTMARARELSREDSDSPTSAPQVLHNVLYLNTGTGRMLEGARLAGLDATDWTWSTRFEDLDNDGWVDLHVTNGVTREYHNVELRDKIMLAENAAERVRLMQASPVFNEQNLAYRNLGDLRFEEVSKAWNLAYVGVSFGAALGDLDGDGDLDLVYSNFDAPPTVLMNESPAGHRVIFALRGRSSNRFGVGATVRIEANGRLQTRTHVQARGYLSSSEPVLHFGLGAATKLDRVTIQWPSGATQVLTDLAADHRYTIEEPERNGEPPKASPVEGAAAKVMFLDESESRRLNLGSRESFEEETQPLIPFRFDRGGPALAIGDLDADGRDDVVMGGTSKQPGRIHRAEGGYEPNPQLPPSRVDGGALLVFDADGDGKTDLLETRSGNNRPANSPEYVPLLHLQTDAGNYRAASDALPPIPLSVGAAVAADFDRDGFLDLFLGGRVMPGSYPVSPKSLLLRNTGGTFTDVTESIGPDLRSVGMVTSALATDLDLDGWVDLLIATEWGFVRFFRNREGRIFQEQTEEAGFAAAGRGWWTSLAGGDFNGDGRLDYVAGNVGLNTSYSTPALIYRGRFGAGNAYQLIEAYEEDGRTYARRTGRTLSGPLPALKRSFPNNDLFARATLSELIDPKKLAAAATFRADQFQSGIFLSQPDGRFRFSPFGHLSQIAPFQGMVVTDFDADGKLDLYAVQNSYAPIASTGRWSGGLSQLLLGDGKGGFREVPVGESGLIVPGDAKAAVVLDIQDDGWADLLVSRNNSTTLAWVRSVSGEQRGNSVRFLLQGRPGNQTAVGAQVAVTFQDGSRQVQEFYAGSGYLSQNAPGCFVAFPVDNPPTAVEIRWPDGKRTPWTGEWKGKTRIVIPEPEN